MINLLTISSLLFSLASGNNYSYFSNRITNSSNHVSFSVYKNLNGIVTRESNPSNIIVGNGTQGWTPVSYTSVIKLSFPYFSSSYLTSSYLYLTKKSGTSISGFGTSYKLAFDMNSNSLGSGWTSFSTQTTLQGNSYTIDISSLVSTVLNSSNGNIVNIYLSLSYSYSSLVTLYGDESSYSYFPYYTINTTLSRTSNHYGNATSYISYSDYNTSNNDDKFNCYGYAINQKGLTNLYSLFDGIDLSTANVTGTIIPHIINHAKTYYNANLRVINSYISPIFSFERRIAFRYVTTDSSKYHFVRQASDGSWSEKWSDTSTTNICTYSTDPNTSNWTDSNNVYYDSDTYYFAISCLGGADFYEEF